MHHNTNPRGQTPNALRRRYGETIAYTEGTAAYQQPAGATQHRCAHILESGAVSATANMLRRLCTPSSTCGPGLCHVVHTQCRVCPASPAGGACSVCAQQQQSSKQYNGSITDTWQEATGQIEPVQPCRECACQTLAGLLASQVVPATRPPAGSPSTGTHARWQLLS
jgi:hypothetical protein